jgi:uncharacterized protein YcaQ
MSRDHLSLSEARRIALAAQGFDRPRPTGAVALSHIRRTIRQLGLLQIDYVNVLVPAHYQVLFSRLGPYKRSRLDDLIYRRREFTEQWAHEASIVPVGPGHCCAIAWTCTGPSVASSLPGKTRTTLNSS